MSKSRPNRKTRKAAARTNAAARANAGGRVTKEQIQIVVRKEIVCVPSRYVMRDMSQIVVDSTGVARVGSAVVCR